MTDMTNPDHVHHPPAPTPPPTLEIDARDWSRPWMPTFLQALCRLPNVSAACRAAAITRETAYRMRREDTAFAEAWGHAKEIAVDLLHQTAWVRATAGVPVRITHTSTRRRRDENGVMVVIEETTLVEEKLSFSNDLVKFLLMSHRPQVFSPRAEIRHSGADGGPVQVEVWRQPDDERTLALARMMLELSPGPQPVIEGTVAEPHVNGDASAV